MNYLLDTNILSDLVRHPQGAVAERIRKAGETQVCTSIIVAAELRYGAAKMGSLRLTEQLGAILAALDILALQPPCDVVYADLRTYLETKGTPIGANDLLIAAQAKVYGLTLVSDNTREFTRVPGLALENWLR